MIEEIAHTTAANASGTLDAAQSLMTFVISIGTFAFFLSRTASTANATRIALDKHQLDHDTDMAKIELELAKVNARTAEIDKEVAVLTVKVGG